MIKWLLDPASSVCWQIRAAVVVTAGVDDPLNHLRPLTSVTNWRRRGSVERSDQLLPDQLFSSWLAEPPPVSWWGGCLGALPWWRLTPSQCSVLGPTPAAPHLIMTRLGSLLNASALLCFCSSSFAPPSSSSLHRVSSPSSLLLFPFTSLPLPPLFSLLYSPFTHIFLSRVETPAPCWAAVLVAVTHTHSHTESNNLQHK